MASSELNRLREEARARHRAATRKVSRLKTNKGVMVSGSEADPRRDPSLIKRYNSRQLRAYIRELNQFTSRQTRFVGDAHSRPMAAPLWAQYKRLEERYNARVRKELEKYNDLYLPTSGMTVAQRMEMTKPKHPHLFNGAVNPIYREIHRENIQVRSESALRTLIADMRKKLEPDYFARDTAQARQIYDKMSGFLKQPKLDKRVRALNDDQFAALWNLTPFATDESLKYEAAKDLLAGKEEPWQSSVIQDATENAYELVKWAESIDLGD